ncbi:unnamed protein product [Arabidopsis halleri]
MKQTQKTDFRFLGMTIRSKSKGCRKETNLRRLQHSVRSKDILLPYLFLDFFSTSRWNI